jgi:hypothetical protein
MEVKEIEETKEDLQTELVSFADLIKEGSKDTEQATRCWYDKEHNAACALSAATLAFKKRMEG